MKNKLNEENLNKIIDDLIYSDQITLDEKKILYKYKKNQDKSFMNRVHYLKQDLSTLNLENGLGKGLSDDVLKLYTELSRKYPKTGPASLFNGLIR